MTAPGGPQPGLLLGQRLGPFPGMLDAELVRAYAEATLDPTPGATAGTAVPPVAVVTQIWEAQQAAFGALVPEVVRSSMTGGVHGEHEVLLHRPIVPGEALQTWVEAQGSRRGGRHNLVTMRYSTYDAAGAIVAQQWWTTVLLNAAGEPVGEPPPDHTFPEAARPRLVAEHRVATDDAVPQRYAEVSGDWSGHHFHAEGARISGFDRPFLHGLCTMAICANGVVQHVAGGDADRVRRVAVRFASPVFVGEEIEMRVHQVDDVTYAFEADSLGAAAIRNGIAELRS